jgi:hypothetical protein
MNPTEDSIMLQRIAIATLLFTVAGTAVAGPYSDKAEGHFRAIATGNLEQLAGEYGSEATLQWVGGPLDGVYSGDDKLREVWTKFTKSQGELGRRVTLLQENANPKGATVTANVEFQGKSAIKVRYVLTYRDGKIVNEIWQIAPDLSTGY